MSQIGHTVLSKLCSPMQWVNRQFYHWNPMEFPLESSGIPMELPLESSGIPLESSGIPLESSGISTESSGISTDPVEFPPESSGNSSGITLFQWKKVPFIPLKFQ